MSHTGLNSKRSDDSNNKDLSSKNKSNRTLTIDQLFPSETNKSGTKGKRLDINTLFSGEETNSDIVIEMSHEVLLERRRKRADEVQRQYMITLKNCWTKIDSADNDGLFETTFEVLPNIPQYSEYSPIDCLNLIQTKLRDEYMNTEILDDNLSIYISWDKLQINKDAYTAYMEEQNKDHTDSQKKSSKSVKKTSDKKTSDKKTSDKKTSDKKTSDNARKEFDIKMISLIDSDKDDEDYKDEDYKD
jgi:hypothetical protein